MLEAIQASLCKCNNETPWETMEVHTFDVDLSCLSLNTQCHRLIEVGPAL